MASCGPGTCQAGRRYTRGASRRDLRLPTAGSASRGRTGGLLADVPSRAFAGRVPSLLISIAGLALRAVARGAVIPTDTRRTVRLLRRLSSMRLLA